MLNQIKQDLKKFAVKEKIQVYQNFFKTNQGQYGEGDIFIGVTVPNTRIIAKKYKNIKLEIVNKLLLSKIHEERMLGALILVQKYKKADNKNKEKIFNFYLQNTQNINNWDLVDLTAPQIIGNYLLEKDRASIYKLVKSKNLWEKRISIVTTFAFIKNNQFEDTLKIAEILLNDSHDLIHKSVGWMLREVGKRDFKIEEKFLKQHYKKMPRTMLRYAIEKFDEELRQKYLKGKI
ncbi:MAG: DNA alkylation repair protein [Nanoarchaeota archaeon]|nr:DNA alkylation repair protein [Nanoarchaeota archaeon]